MMHPKLQEYATLMSFLSKILGSSYEIVLNDLKEPEHSVIGIAGTHLSGRSQHDALSTFALKLWYTKAYKEHDFICNYMSQAHNNRILRSSTFFIKDEEGELLGMLCVNYDNTRHQELARAIMALGAAEDNLEPHPILADNELLDINAQERFSDSSHDIICEIINDKLRTQGLNLLEINPEIRRKWILQVSFEEKIEMIAQMKARGVFYIKGAVAQVARELHCSQPSVYRYLSKTNAIAAYDCSDDKNSQ
jgi:predicted transcriptional regulator YheO